MSCTSSAGAVPRLGYPAPFSDSQVLLRNPKPHNLFPQNRKWLLHVAPGPPSGAPWCRRACSGTRGAARRLRGQGRAGKNLARARAGPGRVRVRVRARARAQGQSHGQGPGPERSKPAAALALALAGPGPAPAPGPIWPCPAPGLVLARNPDPSLFQFSHLPPCAKPSCPHTSLCPRPPLPPGRSTQAVLPRTLWRRSPT